ncbi:glutamate-cysteine ligase family protein [Nocardioides cheoyonin]|uniref:glutamate-cysteine ligase family protein n=1 Tax=Nocardioides cheoyonin TaxID=3156615 RepID=UPI0032B4C096
MGDEVEQQEFTREDRTRYREKVRRNLDVFARMLREERFEAADPMTGLEVELNLVDDTGDPALKNAEALAAIADEAFQTELGLFNIEINVPPRRLREDGLTEFEKSLRASLNHAEERSAAIGAHLVMIGILPTLRDEHLGLHTISANPRYQLLNDQVLGARGEDIAISIGGRDRLEQTSDTIMPEAACTSTQFHVQVRPEEFAAYWNASQAIAAVQLAVGANSPYLLGRELWRETRIPLFEQATDTRSEELKVQGVRPRVWFGERWITSVFDLFEENVRYFPPLLPVLEEEDPLAVLDAGGTPALPELRLHNGTIYRWNRPVYDVVDTDAGKVPHLRVENRVLAAGPTVVDTMANAAFYFGLVRALARSPRPLWSAMSFQAAEENFHEAARFGIDAQLFWPGLGQAPATEIVLRRLLPLAQLGLASWGVESEVADRLLGIIEQRCLSGTNGAEWFVARVHERAGTATGEKRYDALRETLLDYRAHMHRNEPVHTWDPAD